MRTASESADAKRSRSASLELAKVARSISLVCSLEEFADHKQANFPPKQTFLDLDAEWSDKENAMCVEYLRTLPAIRFGMTIAGA